VSPPRPGLGLVLLLPLLAACKSAAPVPLRVAAASDLTEAFTELGARFEQQTGTKVVFSFGSSGLLARQLSEGAPFDVFAAANQAFVDQAVKAGACEGATSRRYARGRLSAWSRTIALTSLESIADPRVKVIALANPEHAPYGRAAKEGLQRAGLWERLEPRVVYAENVRQALQLADTGNADVALVAFANVVKREGGVLVNEDLHAPIEQAVVQCKRGGQAEAGRRFVEFLASPEAREVMQRAGFTIELPLPRGGEGRGEGQP
jgi:molybdate transport system substrate-binding protein